MKRFLWIFAAIALLWYAVFLYRNTVFVAGGSDSSGYANAARAFLNGRLVTRPPMLDALHLADEWALAFAPLGHWKGPKPGTVVPTYPLGLPAQMAMLASLLGERAGIFLLVPLCAIGSLFAMYFLARELGVEPEWSLVGAAILAAFPTFTYMAIQPMSDVPAVLWCTLSILAALKAERRPGLAIIAGALFGVAVAIRPNNVLLIVPLLMIFGKQLKPLALFAAGAAPFAAVLMYANAALYGSPLETGYGSMAELIALKYFRPRFLHYTKWLLLLGTPLLFPLGLLSKKRVLAGWFAAFFLFYCFYEHYREWWYTRFLLPAIPALIVGALLVTSAWDRRIRAVLLISVVVAGAYWSDHYGVQVFDRGEQIYITSVEGMEAVIPERSVVIAMQMSGAIRFYTGRPAVRYDLIDPDKFQVLRAHASATGHRWYALLSDFEVGEANKKTGARWTPIARWKDVSLYELTR